MERSQKVFGYRSDECGRASPADAAHDDQRSVIASIDFGSDGLVDPTVLDEGRDPEILTDAGVDALTEGGVLGEPPADRVLGCLYVTGQQHDLEDLEIESVRAGQLGGEIHRAPREVGTVAENDQMRVLVATFGGEFTGHLNLLERAANRMFGLWVRT